MIKIEHITKSFNKEPALKDLTLQVNTGSIYGLVGTNGAGKSTIIKHLAGVLMADTGIVTIDGQPVFENVQLKERIGYISDDLSFFSSYTLIQLSRLYCKLYPHWNQKRFEEILHRFQLSKEKRLTAFSKGMQKQAVFSVIMSTMPDYLILDEPIDGLDPIVRKIVWQCIIDDVAERQMTVLVSSHNLRELEGVCDCIGIISKGTMIIERDLDELKSDIHKVQTAFTSSVDQPYGDLNIVHREKRGSVDLLIIKNKEDYVRQVIEKGNPAIFDILPLTLEEIFIYELGGPNNENILF